MGRDHPLSDRGAGLAGLALPRDDDLFRPGDFDEQVDAVEKRA
jgi:hypothetical protein